MLFTKDQAFFFIGWCLVRQRNPQASRQALWILKSIAQKENQDCDSQQLKNLETFAEIISVTSISSVKDYLILGACISDHNEVQRRPFGVFQDGLDIEGECLQDRGNIVFVLWRIPRFLNLIFTRNFAIRSGKVIAIRNFILGKYTQ